MAKRKMRQLQLSDCRWYLKDADKAKIIKKCMDIITDPDSTGRDCGIAMRNYIMLNGQNIQICEDNPNKDNNINIIIKEQE